MSKAPADQQLAELRAYLERKLRHPATKENPALEAWVRRVLMDVVEIEHALQYPPRPPIDAPPSSC